MASTNDRADRDRNALELRRAGVSVARIVDRLKFTTAQQAERAIERAMKATGTPTDPADVRALELDRLDRLQQAVWTQAIGGDIKAIDQAQKLAEARVRLAGIAARGDSVMTNAFDDTVEALKTEPEDSSIIASGRRIAERIDTAAASGDALAETKALYLLPLARADLKAKAPNGNDEKRAKLTALRGARTA